MVSFIQQLVFISLIDRQLKQVFCDLRLDGAFEVRINFLEGFRFFYCRAQYYACISRLQSFSAAIFLNLFSAPVLISFCHEMQYQNQPVVIAIHPPCCLISSPVSTTPEPGRRVPHRSPTNQYSVIQFAQHSCKSQKENRQTSRTKLKPTAWE